VRRLAGHTRERYLLYVHSTHGSHGAGRPARGHGAPRSRSAALLLVCIVAIAAASQLTRVMHHALVPHAPCEHGHVAHIALAADQSHARVAGEAHDETQAAVRSSHGPGESHDHCDALAVEQAPLPDVCTAVPSQLLAWELEVQPAGPVQARTAIPLLQLAPKLSPPLA
jgi:hypothetical protein